MNITPCIKGTGRLNLAYESEHAHRRPSVLEVIAEENPADEFGSGQQESSFGFKLSPKTEKVRYIEEDEERRRKEYNLLEVPGAKVSRAELLPYLLANIPHVDDVCTDESCPYNQWLYRDKEYPRESELSEWEEKMQTVISSRLHPSYTECVNILSESMILNPGRLHSEPPTSLPPPYSDISHSPTRLRSPTPDYTSYPIITLPKSARKKKTLLGRSTKGPAPVVKTKPSVDDSKSSSKSWSSSCSCDSGSSLSTCSSCIPVPVDPTAPHAFTIGEKGGRAPGRCRYLPRCDTACCATFSFLVFCVVGLVAVLLYLYFNTNTMQKGMIPY